MDNSLIHVGVLGMKWGIRKEQRAAARSEKKDMKWVDKKGAKVTTQTRKAVSKELDSYARTELGGQARTSSGRLSMTFVNQYNKKLSELMNKRVGDVQAPSGKVLRYIAKRGEVGVHTALADQGYNMDQVKNGVNSSGRVAYKKEVLKKG